MIRALPASRSSFASFCLSGYGPHVEFKGDYYVQVYLGTVSSMGK
jgi:hypothetical protein